MRFVLALNLMVGAVLCGLPHRFAAPNFWPIGRLDEAAGEVAKDVSGHGRDGTIVGAKPVAGAVGGALWFDGQDDYVALGDFGLHGNLYAGFLDQAGRTLLRPTTSGKVWSVRRGLGRKACCTFRCAAGRWTSSSTRANGSRVHLTSRVLSPWPMASHRA